MRRYDPWGWRYRDPFWRLDRQRYNYYVFSNSEKAFERGYKDGLKTGRGDIKNSRSYNPERSHYFQEAGFGNSERSIATALTGVTPRDFERNGRTKEAGISLPLNILSAMPRSGSRHFLCELDC